MNHLTDAEVLAIREKAFEEAKRYCEGLEKENKELRARLEEKYPAIPLAPEPDPEQFRG